MTSEIIREQYTVQFRWLQTAISLRHSDTVDVKFLVNGTGKVVALPHAALEQSCRKLGARLSDELCARIAAEHLRECLRTGVDAEKDLITLLPAEVEERMAVLLPQTVPAWDRSAGTDLTPSG